MIDHDEVFGLLVDYLGAFGIIPALEDSSQDSNSEYIRDIRKILMQDSKSVVDAINELHELLQVMQYLQGVCNDISRVEEAIEYLEDEVGPFEDHFEINEPE